MTRDFRLKKKFEIQWEMQACTAHIQLAHSPCPMSVITLYIITNHYFFIVKIVHECFHCHDDGGNEW